MSDANQSQLLTAKKRGEIETRLKSYDIPVQILQMVARENNCDINVFTSTGKTITRNILDLILPRMDDKSILMLHEIFLECRDSFSHFRFAVYLSSLYSTVRHKFVVNDKVQGASGQSILFDVCIYARDSESLVAVGAQNNDPESVPADSDSIHSFFSSIDDLYSAHPALRGAYYASSSGYNANLQQLQNTWSAKRQKETIDRPMDVRFFEYRDKVYFESDHSPRLPR